MKIFNIESIECYIYGFCRLAILTRCMQKAPKTINWNAENCNILAQHAWTMWKKKKNSQADGKYTVLRKYGKWMPVCVGE